LPRKVSDITKEKIKESFIKGSNIKEISLIYNYSVPTITRQLKKLLGDQRFNKIRQSQSKNKITKKKKDKSSINAPIGQEIKKTITEQFDSINHDYDVNNFVEIKPITDQVEFEIQKEISSQPLENIKFPKVVYMLIEKEIELKPKLLNEYPEWSFLPAEDLSRYTIEIFSEQKEAKMKCNKNQKLLKVPNPNVFFLASNNLRSKGISRMIFGDLLIAI